MSEQIYCVGQYTPGGKRLATISGCGRHEGTLDTLHSQRTAQRHAKEMNERKDGKVYQAEHTNEPQLRRKGK